MLLKHLIKRYLIWMVLSYVVIAGVVYFFVFVPQRKVMEKRREAKAEIEYEYMKITSSPAFIRSLDAAITAGTIKTRDFEWTDSEDIDAGLVFYNYIYGVSKKTGLDLLEVTKLASSRQKQRAKVYHIWKVKLTGSFSGLLSLVDEVEHGRKFLAIEEVSITRGKDSENQTVYEVVFLAIKKDTGDAKKTEI